MKNLIITLFIFIFLSSISFSQVKFRSGLFLHHSTGECIWGPNGSSTSVPQQMTIYNNIHSYTGTNAVTLDETWFPVGDNEWYLWHSMFETNIPENISSYFSSNKIIMIKSCYPSSALEGIGVPGDTLTPDYKTIFNYKWHWRHIISVMKNNPSNFFVIWTNAPLVQAETNPDAAMWSKQFCKWAKDTLANSMDPLFGTFPNNVYVFDFFSKLANANGYLRPEYAQGLNNSHPNAAATLLVAPLLVNEVFDHSIAYELLFGIKILNENVPQNIYLYQNYPNPFNPSTNIKFDIPKQSEAKIIIYDMLGHEVAALVNEQLKAGMYEVQWDGSNVASGVYYYQLIAGDFVETRKMVLLK